MDDATLASTLMTDAARLAVRMRAEGVASERKTSAADLVTAADHACEALVRDTLRHERPDDGLLGEEGTADETDNGRRWIVDPIDGTFNDVSGLDAWCSAIVLEVDGEPVTAAVHRASADETWTAHDGVTTCDGRTVEPIADRPLAAVGVATFVNGSHLADPTITSVLGRLLRAAATVRISGSGTCDLVGVAAGRLGLWVQEDCSPWDWLPGRALVDGAGGAAVVVERDGHTWHLAGTPTAVAEAAALVRAA